MDLQRRLARNTRRLRHARGWSQEELADRADLPVRLVRQIEAPSPRNVTTWTIARLARGLGVDPVDLIMPAPARARR